MKFVQQPTTKRKLKKNCKEKFSFFVFIFAQVFIQFSFASYFRFRLVPHQYISGVSLTHNQKRAISLHGATKYATFFSFYACQPHTTTTMTRSTTTKRENNCCGSCAGAQKIL